MSRNGWRDFHSSSLNNRMALVVRCKIHGAPKRSKRSAYCFVAVPVDGYDSKITCGIRGCKNPGLVFMNVIDAGRYNSGLRTFPLPFHPAKRVVLDEGGRFLSELG